MYCYSPKNKLKLKTKLQLVLIIILYTAIVLSPLYRDKIHQFKIDEFIAGFFKEKVIYVNNEEVPKYNPCELDVVVCDGEKTTDKEAIDNIIKKYFGDNWKLARAVMMAEGNYNPRAFNPTNGSNDRGIWQISAKWHPEVSDACAYNVECSTNVAYQLSKGGEDWSAWWGFRTRSYLKFL